MTTDDENLKRKQDTERKIKRKMVEEMMRNLIETSVGIKINLQPATVWEYDSENKTILYCFDGEKSIFNLTHDELTAYILHEIAHANFTQNIKPLDVPKQYKDYSTLLNTVNDIRAEHHLMRKFPGTKDSFRRTATSTQKQMEEDFIALVPNQINYLLNLRQHQWKFPLIFKNKTVENLFLDTLFKVKKSKEFTKFKDLHAFVLKEIWPQYSKLLEELPDDPPQMQSEQQVEGESESEEQENQPDKNEAPKEQQENQDKKDEEKQENEEQEGSGSSGDNESEEDNEENSSGSGGGQSEDSDEPKDENSDASDGNGDGQESEQQQDSDNSSSSGKTGTNNTQPQQKPAMSPSERRFRDKIEQKLKEQLSDKNLDMHDIVNAVKDHSRIADDNKGKTIGEEIDEAIEEAKAQDNAKREEQEKAKPDFVIADWQPSNFKTYEELYAEIEEYLPYFKSKLQSILKDNQLRRFGGNFTRGKLNSKALYKWKCNSTRIFSQKIHRMNKEYAVTLLIDESSSMRSGNKHINAARAAVLLSEVLSAVHIPFEIRGFNASERLYKPFNKSFNWTMKRNLENIIPSVEQGDSGATNDAFAVNWSMNHLKDQPGERMLMVVCDGEPNPGYGMIPDVDRKRLKGNFSHYRDFELRTEIAKANLEGSVIGVGIQTDISNYYHDNVYCQDISMLPRMILNVIRKRIKRG